MHQKLKNIYNGWKNFIFPDEETEKIAKERAVECAGCKYLSSRFTVCKLCKCYIPAKIRVLDEQCPIKKWLKHEPNNTKGR